MKSIDISDETFKAIQSLAIPFEDTPDTVIERVFEAYHINGSESIETLLNQIHKLKRDNEELKKRIAEYEEHIQLAKVRGRRRRFAEKPIGFKFLGVSHKATNRAQCYRKLLSILSQKHPDRVEELLTLGLNHFSYDKNDITIQKSIFTVGSTKMLANSVFSAGSRDQMVSQILEVFGYEMQTHFEYHFRPKIVSTVIKGTE